MTEIPGQIAIPVPVFNGAAPPCMWCFQPSTRTFQLEPARKTIKKGAAEMIPAKVAPVCDTGFERLSANAEADKGKQVESYVVK